MEFKFIETIKNNKKAQIFIIVFLVLIVAAIISGLVFFSKKDNSNTNKNNQKNNLNQNQSSRVIDGVAVNSNESNLLPIAIMIENYKDIRPQSGLSSANIVYEALAEGGITRFMAIYANAEEIETIGPVRSARAYYVNIAEEYHGLFAHIGGSPEALGVLSFQNYLTDLNQFHYSQYYWRDEDIAAPHNLFTSTNLMTYAIRDLELENVGNYTSWKFKNDNDSEDFPLNPVTISIDFSSVDYLVEWKYNNENNSYTRYNAGEEQYDANNDKILEAKNIVVQYTETSLQDSVTGRLEVETQGEGRAVIFQDGIAIEGKWKKSSEGERTKYYDSSDNEIEFNAGSTWIEIVQTNTIVDWTK